VLEPALPSLLRPILPAIIQRTIRKSLHHQGTGRHTRDEIYAIGKADLDALSALLGDKPYFLGDAPTSVDATTYAFLALTLWAPPSGEEMPRHIRALPNLVAYCERMKARVYPG
jgi:glutathione S-transferase